MCIVAVMMWIIMESPNPLEESTGIYIFHDEKYKYK